MAAPARVGGVDGGLEHVRPPGELVVVRRQHLADVDLAPLAAEAVEQVVLLVLERPLRPPRQAVLGFGQGVVARGEQRLVGCELLLGLVRLRASLDVELLASLPASTGDVARLR